MKHASQAAAITYRSSDRGIQVLVVSARRTPDTWIFPKGHIESGETADTTAIRELREEAGIEAVAVGHVGYAIVHAKETRILLEFILAEYRSEVGSDEAREIRWCSFEYALELLSHNFTRRTLRKARPMIEKRLAPGAG